MAVKNINKQLQNLLKTLPSDFEPDEEFVSLLSSNNWFSGLRSQLGESIPYNLDILNSLPNSAFLLNSNGQIHKTNSIAGKLFGFDKSEMDNKWFRDLFVDVVICDFFLTELVSCKNISGIEVELKCKNGNVIPFLLSGSIVKLSDNKQDYICIAQNISEIKKTHERLREAKLKADQANKAKGEFLANMSHEIRTPLNGIIGLNQLMLHTDLSDNQKEYANMLQFSADSLLGLINDILDFSKIEAGKLDIEEYEFSVKDLINGVCTIFQTQVDKKNLLLETEVDEGIQDVLIGDMARIRQVLVNLISNAIKFTKQGKIFISVLLHEESETKQLLKFSVRDTGIGIPEAKKELIFESFSQADSSTTRKYGGTGLGLSICRKLVWLMRGEMDVFSREKQGSTFWFTLPLEFKPVENNLEIREESEAYNNTKKLQVLLVEDNIINQKVARRILLNSNYEVDIANNGEEAVAMFTKSNYNLMLMDLQMPVMDGFVATKRIRMQDSNIPIIALTANAMKGDKEKCLAAGMDGYTTKPIHEAKLFSLINNLIYKEIDILF